METNRLIYDNGCIELYWCVNKKCQKQTSSHSCTELGKTQFFPVSIVNYLTRSSRPEVFCKKGILRNFAKFTGKNLRQCLFNKVAGLSFPQTDNFHFEGTLLRGNFLAGKSSEISVFHAVIVLSFWFSCIGSSNTFNTSLLLEFFFKILAVFHKSWLYSLSSLD